MTKSINGKKTLVLTLEEDYDCGSEKIKVEKKVLVDEIKTIKYHYFLDEDYPNTIYYYDNIRHFNSNSVNITDKGLYRLLKYYPDLRTKLDTTSKYVKKLLNKPLAPAVLLENKHGHDDKSTYTAVAYDNITGIAYHNYHDSSGCNNEIMYEADNLGFIDTECITDEQLDTLLDYCPELKCKLDAKGKKYYN